MGGGKLAGVRVEASVDECLHMHCVSSCRKEGGKKNTLHQTMNTQSTLSRLWEIPGQTAMALKQTVNKKRERNGEGTWRLRDLRHIKFKKTGKTKLWCPGMPT